MAPFAGSAAPSGWLLCDGAAVSRTQYAALFAVIGTTYGAGDGSTTFNLPDLRGRVPVGLDNMGGASANRVTAAQADSLGGAMGEETHVLTIAEMPSHSHSVARTAQAGGTTFASYLYTGSGVNSGLAGGDQPHNNMQPSLFINWIIKA